MCLIFRDSSFAHASLFLFFHNEEEATWKAICVFCKFVIILLHCFLDSCSAFQHLGRTVSGSVCVQGMKVMQGASFVFPSVKFYCLSN